MEVEKEKEEEKEKEPPRSVPNPPGVIPIYETYPCKEEEEEEEEGEGQFYSYPCKEISIPFPEDRDKSEKKEEVRKETKGIPSKETFDKLRGKKICWPPYSRTWALEKIEKRYGGALPKWFSRRREPDSGPVICPTESEEENKNFRPRISKCEKKEKEECKEPIDGNLCVFCLGSLYLDGYIHDLFEKVPKIKKQSEKYGDDIAERIGIRTRITVHKKCYDHYIDFIKHKEEQGEEEGGKEEEEDDEEMTCEVKGDEEEEDEDEDGAEGGEGEQGKGKSKKGKRLKAHELSRLPKKPHFCLRKWKIPKVGSGECVRPSVVEVKRGSIED